MSDTQEKFVRFTCPHCGQSLEIAAEHAGALIDCPKCKQQTRVPLTSPQPSAKYGTGHPPPVEPPPGVPPHRPYIIPPTPQNKWPAPVVMLAIVGMLLGIGFFINGCANGDDSNWLGEIYRAIYLVGGAVVFGIALLFMAIAPRD